MTQTWWTRTRQALLAFSAGVVLCSQALALSIGGVVLGDEPLEGNANIALGLPHQTSTSQDEILISRQQYVMSWNPSLRLANWVAWKLDGDDMGDGKHRSAFRTDPDLASYLRGSDVSPVSPTEYKGSCFDRGHQIPAADRTATDEDNASTFYMSNMVPQTAWLNRLQWKHGENFERRLVRNENKTVYLISGVIFDKDNPRYMGTSQNIAVPSSSFKIIVAVDNGDSVTPGSASSMLVVKMPNVNSDGSDPFENIDRTCEEYGSHYAVNGISDEHLDAYRTTLADIESLTGYRFFDDASQRRKQSFWAASSFFAQ